MNVVTRFEQLFVVDSWYVISFEFKINREVFNLKYHFKRNPVYSDSGQDPLFTDLFI